MAIWATGMCKHCGMWPTEHVNNKCLFVSTNYEKYVFDPYELSIRAYTVPKLLFAYPL